MKQRKRVLSLTCALLFGAAGFGNTLAEPVTPPDLDETGSVTIRVVDKDDDIGVVGGSAVLYQVAEAAVDDGNYSYQLIAPFDLFLGSLDNPGESSLAGQLDAYMLRHKDDADRAFLGVSTRGENDERFFTGTEMEIGEDGVAVFDDLSTGLYLISQYDTAEDYLPFSSFVVTVPLWDETKGEWIYDVDASPKMEAVEATTEMEVSSQNPRESTHPEEETTTEPDTEPVEVSTEPVTEPDTEPVEVSTEPTPPDTEPTPPDTEPVEVSTPPVEVSTPPAVVTTAPPTTAPPRTPGTPILGIEDASGVLGVIFLGVGALLVIAIVVLLVKVKRNRES